MSTNDSLNYGNKGSKLNFINSSILAFEYPIYRIPSTNILYPKRSGPKFYFSKLSNTKR